MLLLNNEKKYKGHLILSQN